MFISWLTLLELWEHKNNVADGFTKRYSVHDLIYYEILESALASIEREKQIKKMGRKKKEAMILKLNPTLKDLYEEIIK